MLNKDVMMILKEGIYMDKLKFGAYIKQSRINKNYTQKELADLLFVDVSTVSKWERGVSYPDITLVGDICKVLDISEHELIASGQDNEYRKIQKDAKKYNNMKKGTFVVLNICYAVALISCFIVNVSISHTLTWFYIVLSSLLCAYSFCPTYTWIFSQYKNLVFIGSTFLSMFLLFLTCSIYTNNYWFMVATLGVLLGYFIVLYPILFKKWISKISKYKILSKSFLLSYILGIFILISLLLISIYYYKPFNLENGILILSGCFSIPLGFGVINLFEFAKYVNKLVLISLGVIFVVLSVVLVARAGYLQSTQVLDVYPIEETYHSIKVEGNDLDISVYLSNHNENKVECIKNEKIEFQVEVVEGVLTIKQIDNRNFYDKIFSFNHLKVNLYLTNEVIEDMNIQSTTGNIKIDNGFNFENVNITNTTGDIYFNSNVKGNIEISNTTGDINIIRSNIFGYVNVKTKTGDVEMENVNCNKLDILVTTGDSELVNVKVNTDFTLQASTGDVELDGFDANNMNIKVKTGDVEGTILSSKIFITSSDTGMIKVPETVSGGICKITTNTGNIKISYK